MPQKIMLFAAVLAVAVCFMPQASHAAGKLSVKASASESSVSLSWNKAKGAKEYKVSVNGKAIKTTKKPQAKISGLDSDTEYKIKVTAYGKRYYNTKSHKWVKKKPKAKQWKGKKSKKVKVKVGTTAVKTLEAADEYGAVSITLMDEDSPIEGEDMILRSGLRAYRFETDSLGQVDAKVARGDYEIEFLENEDVQSPYDFPEGETITVCANETATKVITCEVRPSFFDVVVYSEVEDFEAVITIYNSAGDVIGTAETVIRKGFNYPLSDMVCQGTYTVELTADGCYEQRCVDVGRAGSCYSAYYEFLASPEGGEIDKIDK